MDEGDGIELAEPVAQLQTPALSKAPAFAQLIARLCLSYLLQVNS